MHLPHDKRPHINITKYSFKKWLEFVFDHPVNPELRAKYSKQPEKSKTKAWYWQEKWAHYCNPRTLFKNTTRLFNNPQLFKKYSDDQINQALYYLNFGAGLDDKVSDAGIPWAIRKAFIHSTESLYKNLFTSRKIEDACSMFWDWIANHRNFEPRQITPDSQKVMDTMFEVLKNILKVNSERCRQGALHGLGHLQHPKTKSTIDAFLKENPDLNKNLKEYAKKCRAGKML